MFFFSRLSKKKKSASIAKKRIQNILLSDRADCSSDLVNAIKGDIGQTLSKYMDVESHEISLDFMPESSKNELNSKMYLIATIPFREINKVIY
ncbi:MAG: cell division topological specificity factor MinE [Lachnospiraceae bacterium]|nr:cell division topological specificity factor MinE [Lachnospiraceae bacterium]